MIIVDYSQIALSNIIVQKIDDKDLIRHMILNSLRMYNKKYRDEYGQMVLACDGFNTWRKEFFPEYKAARKKNRSASDLDWNNIFTSLNEIREEIKENLPSRSAKLRYAIKKDDFYDFETDIFDKFKNLIEIESYGDKL